MCEGAVSFFFSFLFFWEAFILAQEFCTWVKEISSLMDLTKFSVFLLGFCFLFLTQRVFYLEVPFFSHSSNSELSILYQAPKE